MPAFQAGVEGSLPSSPSMTVQNYTIELRFDYIGIEDDARKIASEAIDAVYYRIPEATEVRVSTIFNEDWEEV